MRITDEQKDRANTVNLPQFLMANGFDLKRVGKEYVWKEHDSLHIRDNAPGERGKWFRFSENKGGDNIGFLREYMGMSFVEAVEALTGEHIDRTYTPQHTYQPKPVQQKAVQNAPELSLAEADNARRVFAYLCKTRGLDYDMVAALVRGGSVSQEEKTGNVLFKYYNEQGKVVGAEKVGTSTEKKFKGIATGSTGGHGFEVVRGSGEKAFFFESAIDMLSYLQMHDRELENCRLVSMMGVKPNIVLDTMLRHNISPENVFLCSDNDQAGNEFAQRLQEQYPEMKRISTPDTYKDWNDMLRGIPKERENDTIIKEVQQKTMQTYGNKTWNDATDNRDKSLVTMSDHDFDRMREQLENAGMNYYGYVRGESVIMAVNDRDVDMLRKAANAPTLEPRKSDVPYSPPQKNIIGNAEYRYIPQKEYVSADRDLILKMAERMEQQGLKFSGRIYPSGKGTLTVSHSDLAAVRAIQQDIIERKKSLETPERGQEHGSYQRNADTRYFMSKIPAENWAEVEKFLDTNISYHAVARDGKIAFALDKDDASAFHRVLQSAEREVNLVHTMQDMGLSMEQMVGLSPTVHRLAADNFQLNIADFFDNRYDEAQFGEMLSLVNDYLAQSPAERFGEHSKLNDMLEAKSNFDRSIELSDFFSQHDFSDEQKAAISAMFVGDVTRGQIDSIDETFTVEDIHDYDLILHTALQESEIADFLTAHKYREPTEEELLFEKADLAAFLASRTLSSDEWEDLAYPLFENGYTDKHKPSEKAVLGYHLPETELFALAERFHQGEDIRRELADGLMIHATDNIMSKNQLEFVFEDGKISDHTYYYADNLRHTMNLEFSEDGIKCSFGDVERNVSYEEIGQAFIDHIHEEFEDLMYWRVLDYIKDDIPDISDETVQQLITAFDGAALHGWENGENQPKINRIKKALYDILGDEEQTEKAFACIAEQKYNVSFEPEKQPDSLSFHFGKDKSDEWVSESGLVDDFVKAHPDCSLALGNALFEYLDEKQHSERNIPELKAGWYKKTDFSITAVIGGEEFNYDGRFDIGDGKGTGGGSLIDHIRDYNQGILNATQAPFNKPEYKERAQRMLDIFIPFLEAHSELTAEEQRIFDDFKEQHPIRTYDDIEKEQSKFQIYQLPGGDKYHGIRFEGMEQLKSDGVQLNHDDYVLFYEGEIADFKGNATLEAIFAQFNTNPPANFTGHSLSVSDVIVIETEGKQTAYYCDTAGFTEMPEFFREKEKVQEKSAVQTLTFMGDADKFDAIKSHSHNDSFGTTITDGNTLTVVINDNATIEDVRELVTAAQENDVYLNIPSAKMLEERFGSDFMQESPKPTVADLEVGDIIMYEGKRREVEEISDERIKMKDLDAPDYGGILLSTSDVLSYDSWQADMEERGFEILSKAEKSEPVVEAPEKSVHQLITNAGLDGGIDDKKEYATVDEAVKAGKDYLSDGYLGFAVFNNETKEIEHTEGDFPLTKAFNAEILRQNGINEPEDKGYVTMAKVGDFYELYGKDAEIAAEILDLHLSSKSGSPMVGFPDHVRDEYSRKLGEAGYTVLTEQAERSVVADFRAKTSELFKPMDHWTPVDIEGLVGDHVIDILQENGVKFNEDSVRVVLNGSRARGIERPDSDVDVVVEIDTDEREDSLFNMLHAEPFMLPTQNFQNIPIDINPITPYETGTLETYLPQAEAYLSKKAEKLKTEKNMSPLDRAINLINDFCVDEYSTEADFSDMSSVSLAYTTDEKNDLPIQVTADLEDFVIYHEYDGEIFATESFLDLEDMINNGLTGLDFDELVSIPDDVIERYTDKEKLTTLQDVVDKYFGTDCESAETDNGTWKLSIADGDKVGELFHNGEAVCGIYNRSDKMEIEPYEELTAFPKLLADAMLAHNPDKPVEIMDFQRTFETPLDKAKFIINEFCEGEYEQEADFSNLHNVGLAFTTLTDDDLPIQVMADLVDFKITYEFANEVFKVEEYSDIEDMIENGLTGLDFSDLVDVPDDIIAKSQSIDEQTVDLMSDAAEVKDISSQTDEPKPITMEFKGDSESLDEISDYALSIGAVVIKDNAHGTLSVDTFENHQQELQNLAYMNGVFGEVKGETAPEQTTDEKPKTDIDEDTPLFSDASVIEEIKRNEHSSENRPFWETPDVQGEQLSLFGDPEPIQQTKPEKPKSEFAKGPVVDGVQVYEALAAEIDRGTGFVNGKLRVQEFYDENHPTTQQLADFLKDAYGTGGHTGEGNISLVNTDSKGMTFDFENGEKFRHSWYNVATMTESRLRDNTYLSAEQQEQYAQQKAEKSTLTPPESKLDENENAVNIGDKFRNKMTGDVSEVVSLEGAIPWQTDDVTITTDKGSYATTESISLDRLLNTDYFERVTDVERTAEVGKSAPEKVEPVKSEKADTEQAAELPTPKNLSQLKKAIKPGMMFEITDHLRPECIGERRIVTGVNSVDFTSRKLDENGEPMGKDLHMEFDRAKNWSFDGAEMTSRLDNGDVLMSFHFIDSLEREQTAEKTESKDHVPVYTGEWAVADNRELYKEIVAENERFAKMASEVIGNGKNPVDSVKALTEEFGFERTALLTALNIVDHPGDGRFYQADKEWACEVLALYLDVKPDEVLNHTPEKRRLFDRMVNGANLYSIHNTHLAQFAETLIPEYEKFLERSRPVEKSAPEQTAETDVEADRAFLSQVIEKFGEHYDNMYQNNDDVIGYSEAVAVGDEFIKDNPEFMGKLAEQRNDAISSDRETAALAFALVDVGLLEKFVDEPKISAEKTAPTLDVGDTIEYKSKEYQVESLDMDGYITLTNPEINGMVKDRVTFIADEFLNSAEFKVIEPKTEPTAEKSDNFTITDDSLGEGGAKAKFRANVDAIKTLKLLEMTGRSATTKEQETLSKYVGWGALPQAFDKNDSKWSAEYAELKDLLTPQEYAAARATVNDAFFTSPAIIEGIYEALGNFGFEGGNILEPSMGVGNFFGCMPSEMQEKSNLYGVEIDSISGRIAQALYPDADIAIQGFEKNSFQNGCFDVAVGNVPFGDLGFKDEQHGSTKLHDYFFLEAMDKLKNGGIMAFVTSSGTLDKRDESVRQMLADKADLIGAIRLPGGKNGAFHDNAGTDVTTDIIFLQKHEGKTLAEMSDIPDWVHIGETADGLPINQYFEQHPDMVLGEVIKNTNPRGGETMVVAPDGFDLKTALHEAVGKLSAEISHDLGRDVYAKTAEGVQVQIPSNLRNYSFFMSDDQVYFKKNNAACEFRFDKGTAQHKRFKAFIELRDTTRDLIEAMELDKPDSVIKALQEKLNTAYDDFYKKYGLIHSQTNKRYFSEDVSYNLVAALEKSYDKTKLKEKSDIFTKRTIVPPKAVEHVDTALEALTLSVAEKARVDFEYMGRLTGMTEDELKHDLSGEIFKVPHTENTYQTASEYLSGDIRAKLREAEEIAEYDADFNINVSALKKAMPEPLKAGDIDVKIGATWLDPKYYEQFMYELLQTPAYQRSDSPSARWNRSAIIGVEYSEHSNSYHVSNKSADKSVLATQKFGSHRMNAYDIFEHILNLQEPKVYKTIEVPDGLGDMKEKRVVDIDATRVVQRKADDMRKAFKDWIFKDPARREDIVQRYNELFNSVRPREYDGSHLTFPMMNADIHLHDHQKNAIAHAMFGGNTLFAHSVGAGKTFEMIATAMESKRLGLCTKSLFAVPNHLTEQIGDDFQKLYPGANILVATKKDFKKENRQQLFAKIATGNYDAVIIGHSQLGMIPVSRERQVMTIQSQIDDILQGIEELKKSEGSKFQIKAMERTRKSLQKQLDKLEKANQDDTLTFEQLGIDRLFVDEAHEFKNLFVNTKLQNVAGISSSASQKALDLFLKCRYLDEKTGGRGVCFATGTPLSNSITELHTMMRYLEYDFLKDHGLQHFDNWVAVFGEQKTDWELKPAGNGFKERTRIANYTGLPELMSMFKQVADIRTADTLKLDVPDCDYQVVQVEATPFQQELVQELSDRADAINGGNVDPSIDNMLKITSDGRKLGLDPRLIDPSFEDNPETKLNKCVENVARIHAETAEDKLTQIIFCDLGVPHKSSGEAEVEGEDADDAKEKKSMAEVESLEEECDFCVYDDIRDKLIAKGIPAEEIAYIHDAKTEKQKADLFDKVRSGEIRVLLGSTAKMGTGTNVQKKLIAVHDLDIPWRPADLERAPVKAAI